MKWLLDHYDADRGRDLCFGTVDTWITWVLTNGRAHVTDATNAAVTGLQRTSDHADWDPKTLEQLAIPERLMPRIVDSTGVIAPATALPGAPPIAAILGDQQASLIGQGGVHHGDAKITFGTGAMLDLTLGTTPPAFSERGKHGTFPIIAWREHGDATYGIEAIMLAAGTSVQWLRDDLQLIASSAQSHDVAASVRRHRWRRVRPGAARTGHAGMGLRRTRRAVRAHARHRRARTSCAPCSKASRNAVRISSTRPKPTPASRSPRCVSTAA